MKLSTAIHQRTTTIPRAGRGHARGAAILVATIIVLCAMVVSSGSGQPVNRTFQFRNLVFGPSKGVVFKNPEGIAFDPTRGEVYVADTGNHAISVFELTGRHLVTFPCKAINPRTGKEIPAEPKGIAVDPEGNIYYTDGVSGMIQVRNYRGEGVNSIDVVEKTGLTAGKTRPEYLFLDGKGNLYVTVAGAENEIVVLNRDREVVRRLKGTGEGFTALTGVWVDSEGKIYVTDAINDPGVQIYDEDGRYLFGFGAKDIGDENLSQPRGIITTTNGDIWVVDTVRQVVKRYDRNGRFLQMFGGYGVKAGDFIYPVGIVGDGVDDLFILERVGSRYQHFRFEETGDQGG